MLFFAPLLLVASFIFLLGSRRALVI